MRTHCKRGHELTPENRDSSGRCRPCINERGRGYYREKTPVYRAARDKWKSENPEKYKNAVLKSVHGITLERFNEKLKTQDYRCAICKKKFSKSRKPYVDHVHDETKRVRDLLCQKCNSLLGFAEECIETLSAAVIYLRHHDLPKQLRRRGATRPLRNREGVLCRAVPLVEDDIR